MKSGPPFVQRGASSLSDLAIATFTLILFCLPGEPCVAAKASSHFEPPGISTPEFPPHRFNVMQFGATGTAVENDTAAINRTIAACSAAGGGDVIFPAGRYLAASIHLLSNVRLRLDPAAVITGAADGYDPPEPNEFDRYQDFGHSHFHNALMWGENLENVSIVGGKINGGHIVQGTPKPGQDIGDKVIAIKRGRNLHFTDITHETGGHFVYLLNDCENVTLANITVEKSRDAVDLMGCRNVQLHGCRFTGCGDDTVGIKSDYALGRRIKTENIYIWDCYFETDCNGVQFGSETTGDFSNINVWNVSIGKAGKAALGIISADGATIDGVHYRDITIRNATNPIFMQISKRLRTGQPNQEIGTIRNVTISNVTVTDCKESREGGVNPITLSGHPESAISNVVMENITVVYPGGGSHEQASLVPRYPAPAEYQPRYLGIRPASGLYARHIRTLALHNVQFAFEKKDQRPPLVLLAVDGVTLDNFRSEQAEDVETLRLERTTNVKIANCPRLSQRTISK